MAVTSWFIFNQGHGLSGLTALVWTQSWAKQWSGAGISPRRNQSKLLRAGPHLDLTAGLCVLPVHRVIDWHRWPDWRNISVALSWSFRCRGCKSLQTTADVKGSASLSCILLKVLDFNTAERQSGHWDEHWEWQSHRFNCCSTLRINTHIFPFFSICLQITAGLPCRLQHDISKSWD